MELKAFNSERIYWAVEQVERVAGDIDSLRLDDNLFYIKSEANRYIGELEEKHKKEVKQLLILNREQANSANRLRDNMERVIRRHKRKRCLNKAEGCEERCERYDLLQEHSGFSWRREIDFYFRWYQRWLALAEKFKEAK